MKKKQKTVLLLTVGQTEGAIVTQMHSIVIFLLPFAVCLSVLFEQTIIGELSLTLLALSRPSLA